MEQIRLERIRQLVGKERLVEEVSRELYMATLSLHAPVVGAMHLHCADEAEFESANVFHHGFVEHLLPKLKLGHRAAFRLATLGGRYEWGAIRIAEHHFATPETQKSYKLLVVKVNAHVGVQQERDGDRFGSLHRYETTSPCCGALCALLDGGEQPFLQELGEAFQSENTDRLGVLRDETRVDPRFRSLLAALVSARLQARQVMLDIQDFQSTSPTFYLVFPCVTLNRRGRDTEIVCGFYSADRRGGATRDEYFGLGDDPGAYRVSRNLERYHVEERDRVHSRAARDHRLLIQERWRERNPAPMPQDEQLERIREDVVRDRHHDHRHAKTLLRLALPLLAEVAPVPVAILLFAQGIVGIHHAYRAHRLANEVASSHEAQQILHEIHAKIDTLEPAKAQALIELLVSDYK